MPRPDRRPSNLTVELMSSPQQQTYTPAQYLEAGYRAEMAGERERAAQYYNYLAEVFADIPEGEAARAGMARLGYATRPSHAAPASSPASAQQSSPQGHHAAPAPTAQPRSTSSAAAAAPSQSDRAAGPQRIRLGDLATQDLTRPPRGQSAHAPAASGHPPVRTPVATAAAGTMPVRVEEHARGVEDAEDMRLPEVVARRAREMVDGHEGIEFEQRYRGARILAHALAWIGWITAAGSLAFAVLGVFGLTAGLAGVFVGLPGGLVVGILGVVSGLALVLSGQVALAIFDQAQSLREIGVVVRTRANL